MRKLLTLCLLSHHCLFALGELPYENETQREGVTFRKTVGRFGDNLIAYSHAKWVSYKYGVPLYIPDVPLFEELRLSRNHLLFSVQERSLKQCTPLGTRRYSQRDNLIFYIAPYFPECQLELKTWKEKRRPFFEMDWEDEVFLSELRDEIAPIDKLNLALPPEGSFSIAIHMRMGGGFDNEKQKLSAPLKFPPLDYYYEQLKSLIKAYPDRELYVYLFTDHQKPAELAFEFEKRFPDLVIDYRREENHHTKNVLEDFFSLPHYDCLIRAASNFSIMAGKLHRYDLEIYPVDYKLYGNKVKITRTEQRERS